MKTITLTALMCLLMLNTISANPFTKTTRTNLSRLEIRSFSDYDAFEAMAKKRRRKKTMWSEGSMAITLGYGFPNIGRAVFKRVIDASVTDPGVSVEAYGIGPLHFRFDYAITDRISLGLSANFVKFGYRYSEEYSVLAVDEDGLPVVDSITGSYVYNKGLYDYDYGFTSLNILARFNAHWPIGQKADFYAGIGAGYNSFAFKLTTNEPNFLPLKFSSPIPIGFETTAGVRFLFTDNFGAYVEVGFSKSLLQGGLALKF
jgi:opacity protein-like surface antigen